MKFGDMKFKLLQISILVASIFHCLRARQFDGISMRTTEELVPGSYVGNFRDAARLMNQYPDDHPTFHYQFSKNSNLFAIDSTTSVITNKVRIDREVLALTHTSTESTNQGVACKSVVSPQGLFSPVALLRCFVNLEIIVRSSRLKDSKFYTLSIEVIDINDNTASWPSGNVTLVVPEHSPMGMEFKLPSAYDPDFLENGRLDYYVREDFSKLPFKLQSIANRISLAIVSNIDREVKNQYRFLLHVKDASSSPRSANIPVTISISDINDHRPRFLPTSPEAISISESTASGEIIHRFEAIDADSQSELRYRFDASTAPAITSVFRLEELSGELVLIEPVDRETKADYLLNVIVSDGQFEADISLRVVVADVNDEAPTVDIQPSSTDVNETAVYENDPVGTLVAYVWVRDPDRTENSELVSCWLPIGAAFTLRNWTGSGPKYGLYTANKFDSESTRSVPLLITCVDGGQPPLITSRHIDIQIKDVNDNAPILPSVLHATVRENTPVHYPILQVNASDSDLGRNSQVQYHLNNAQVRRWSHYGFEINQVTGELTVKQPFDSEDVRSLILDVFATDNGAPPLTTQSIINITVIDENDCDPVFTESVYRFEVSEDEKKNTLIGSVLAIDRDATAPNNVLRYSINRDRLGDYVGAEQLEKANITQFEIPFIINSMGEIFVSGKIDYEERHEYAFTVYVSDGGSPPRFGTAVVVISVKDLNDHAPEWIFPNSSNKMISCSIHDPVSTQVGRLLAVDKDSNGNGDVSYYLLRYGEIADYFTINERNGHIYLSKRLETRHIGIYKLLVEVIDHGTKPLQSQAVIDVNVTDISKSPQLTDTIPSYNNFGEKTLVFLLAFVVIVLFTTLFIIACVVLFRRKRIKQTNRHAANSGPDLRGEKFEEYEKVLDVESRETQGSRTIKAACKQPSATGETSQRSSVASSSNSNKTGSHQRTSFQALTLPTKAQSHQRCLKYQSQFCSPQVLRLKYDDNVTPVNRILATFQTQSDTKYSESSVFNSGENRRNSIHKISFSPEHPNNLLWHSLDTSDFAQTSRRQGFQQKLSQPLSDLNSPQISTSMSLGFVGDNSVNTDSTVSTKDSNSNQRFKKNSHDSRETVRLTNETSTDNQTEISRHSKEALSFKPTSCGLGRDVTSRDAAIHERGKSHITSNIGPEFESPLEVVEYYDSSALSDIQNDSSESY